MLSEFPLWITTFFAAVFGLLLGSFANVCIIRIPAGESIAWPPSHCRSCGRRLKWWENIPLFSFLFLRGRCRTCSSKISFVYPLVETAVAILSVGTWLYFQDPKFYFTYLLLFILPLVIVSFIDIAHLIIPDIISVSGIFVGILVHAWLGEGNIVKNLIDSLLGILIGGGVLFIVAMAYEKLKKCEGLGGGDVKLAAMLGAFLGWKSAIFVLLLSSVVGTVCGLILIIIYRKNSKYAIPYGPFLALAGILYLFWGPRMLNWYLSFFF